VITLFPPLLDRLLECLNHLELFLHDDRMALPLLVQVSLVHVQFETIHPFPDGNGRNLLRKTTSPN